MAMIKLNNPVQSAELDRMMIAAIKFENNPFIGQDWTEIYLVLGYYSTPGDETTFVEMAHPHTHGSHIFIQFEDGFHPERPGLALGKCDTCGKWYQAINGDCSEQGCSGSIGPYDGHTRFMQDACQAGESLSIAGLRIAYTFLLTEVVPDPDDYTTERPIVSGVIE
jgi:hypothetical protein